MTICIYFNGFWSGFFERTNPVHVQFFVDLMKKVYNDDNIQLGTLETADVLIENTQANPSLRTTKQWRHTFLFSGESYIRADRDQYSCVLFGNRNHGNTVNVPLYVPYIACSHTASMIHSNHPPHHVTAVPTNDVLVIISNPGGGVRNAFLDALDKSGLTITYAGNYKNNIGGPFTPQYNTHEFRDYVKQFKFMIAMENSHEETYITEKIIQPILSGSIPVYWGSNRVLDYFNEQRILRLPDGHPDSITTLIHRMRTMTNTEWLQRVNARPFTVFGTQYTSDMIAKHVRALLFPRRFPQLTATVILCNRDFEPARYNSLRELCQREGLTDDNTFFISPTYKHTLTDEDMHAHVRHDYVRRVRRTPTKRAEVSLTLNFRAALDFLRATYRDGIFLTLESDAYALPALSSFDTCLEKLKSTSVPWSAVSIGGKFGSWGDKTYCDVTLPYRTIDALNLTPILQQAPEDISTDSDTDVRFMRKFHTRCTDSILWSQRGCEQFSEYMRMDENYGAPFDYYLTNAMETDMTFRYYWSDVSYFDQASNNGMDASTIQQDSR